MRLAGVLAAAVAGLVALPAMADPSGGGASAPLPPPPPPQMEAIPANGVDAAPRKGFFVEAGLGIFTAIGGDAGLSNGQPYLSMAFGHHIGNNGAIFLGLGIGANSSNCYDTSTGDNCDGADSFAAQFYELGGSYGGELIPRLHLAGKLVAGLTQFSPSPIHNAGSTLSDPSVSSSLIGFHFGVGAGLDYDTHLDHFSVGLDLTVRYSIATVSLASVALTPRVRYVF